MSYSISRNELLESRSLFHIINSLLLTEKSDSVIDYKARILKCDSIIDCKTRSLLLTEKHVFICICKTSIIDRKTRLNAIPETCAKITYLVCRAWKLSLFMELESYFSGQYAAWQPNDKYRNGWDHTTSWTVVWSQLLRYLSLPPSWTTWKKLRKATDLWHWFSNQIIETEKI
jgi:hypothetical protein